MDRNYQVELLKELLKQKGQENIYEQVIDLDNAVEAKINDEEVTAFKKWYIKKIEFGNFLSYGDNQVLDFEKCNGITVVESNPPNFGGKCVRGNTDIEIDFDIDYIINKLGFLPDELK
jgi:hypothetical protein